MTKNKRSGFTLIELMITLIIVGIVLSAALITMFGYLPKQRLLATVSYLESMLQRGQAEATSRTSWMCVRFDTSAIPQTATLYQETQQDPIIGSDPSWKPHHENCNAAGKEDTKILQIQFKDSVQLAGNEAGTAPCGYGGPVLYIDTTGTPYRCPNTGIECTIASLEILLKNTKMESLTRTREIEFLSTGLIKVIKPNDKGLSITNYAASPQTAPVDMTAGCN